jgi:hypothetical protein
MKQQEDKTGQQTSVQRTVSMPAINDARTSARPTSVLLSSQQSHASVPEDDEHDSGIATGTYFTLLCSRCFSTPCCISVERRRAFVYLFVDTSHRSSIISSSSSVHYEDSRLSMAESMSIDEVPREETADMLR